MKNNEKAPREKRQPTLFVASLPIIFMVIIIGFGFTVYKLPLPMLLIFSSVAAAFVAKYLGYSWKEMIKAASDRIGQSTEALFVLICVGMLIGSWMAAGTLPMMIYYGIQIINPKFLYVTTFFVTAIVSIFTGTSYGSAGTMGVVAVSIASSLGMSLPVTAGAAVAGAYFGDKMSPLSDTTILASTVTDTDIYEHIVHMLWTTIPASVLGIVVYLIVGFNSAGGAVDSELVTTMMSQLSQIYDWNVLLLLPLVIVLVGSAMKYPTVPVMFFASMIACVLGITIQGFSFTNVIAACARGFRVTMVDPAVFDPATAIDGINRLLNRGGMSGMMELVLIVFSVYLFGAIISSTGCLDVMLQKLQAKVKSDAGVVASTIAACLLVSLVCGVSYLSILIPAELFRDLYKKRGLASCNLSRTLEDSGTVVTALLPWSGGGAYMAGTLGVATIEYLPWAIMNYTGFIFAIVCAVTGIGIKRTMDSKAKTA